MQATWGKQRLSFPETMQNISESISPVITNINQKVNTWDLARQVALEWICLTERGGRLRSTHEIRSYFSSSKLLLNFVMVQYQTLLGGR